MPETPSVSPGHAPQHVLLNIEGMHCAGCAARIEQALGQVPGVHRAQVNLVTNQASVEFDGAGPRPTPWPLPWSGPATAPSRSRRAGAGADLLARQSREAAAWRRRLLAAIVLLAPLLWTAHVAHAVHAQAPWWPFLLDSLLQFYVGWPYLKGAAARLRHASANMDTLIALGTLAAYAAGVAALLLAAAWPETAALPRWSGFVWSGARYFADGGMILTFITLGKFLEAKARGRASEAIRKLLDLAPPEATVMRDGRPQRVPVTAIAAGETIVVRPGEKVPLDARIVSGASSAGPVLAHRRIDARRQAAGRRDLCRHDQRPRGIDRAEVTRPAGQTALAQVIDLVRRAQQSKTDVGRLADRVVAWFVPAVLAIALLTLAAWGLLAGNWTQALSSTMAVLVVACPCALGAGHAHGDARGQRARGGAGHPHQGSPRPGDGRPARYRGAGQDRHGHAGPARGHGDRPRRRRVRPRSCWPRPRRPSDSASIRWPRRL